MDHEHASRQEKREPSSTHQQRLRTVLAPIHDTLLPASKHHDERDGGVTSELREQKLQRTVNVETWSRVCDGEEVEYNEEGMDACVCK